MKVKKTDEPYICYKCIGDRFLRSEIVRNGEYIQCDHCRRRLKGYSLERLADRCEEAFLAHYERTSDEPDTWQQIMLSDRESTYSWDRDGYDAIDLLMDEANISRRLAGELLELLEQKHKDFEADVMGMETEFSPEAKYDNKSLGYGTWQSEWENFEHILKSQSRYFNQHIEGFLSRVFSGLDKLKTKKGKPIIIAAGPGTGIEKLFRARVFQLADKLKEALKDPAPLLGPPPSNLAKAGRMNASGIPVFYGATEAKTAIAEVRPPVGSTVAVASFAIIRPIQLLDLTSFEEMRTWFKGSIFDPSYEVNLKRNVFLRNISNRMIMPVMPDHESFEYLPTQVIADFLSSRTDVVIDGIIYKSVQVADASVNVVLFNKASRVEKFDMPNVGHIDPTLAIDDEDLDIDGQPIYMEVTKKRAKAKKSATISDALKEISDLVPIDQIDERKDTLKIAGQDIAVHIIRAVGYSSQERMVKWRKPYKLRHIDF